MSYNYKEHAMAFAQFLPNMVKLDELQKITQNLDQELAESQKIMKEIKTMFDAASQVNVAQVNNKKQDNIVTHTITTEFLGASVPNLIMSDMENVSGHLSSEEELQSLIAIMKNYAENLRNEIARLPSQTFGNAKEFEKLDLKEYAINFDQLAKSLANIKFNKGVVNHRNLELEAKLAQLCEDVHSFTQMVETKTAISESNKNWTDNQQGNEQRNTLYYDETINKLLNGINEVTYLLKNKH
ncbi:uncharacterized protein LOC123723283 [Papilio machaon]|uniref:uncharacterized protein LOC123723283 n=1 Tax=Papilio machaon TaxID=76193 RepID=UPI001E6634CD|nr:uncharacterized protein LOC123723283 [Papilio machaon]